MFIKSSLSDSCLKYCILYQLKTFSFTNLKCMPQFIKLIPIRHRQIAILYQNNQIQLTPTRSAEQSKLLQTTTQLIKWMVENPVCKRSWVDLMYKILRKFKLAVLGHFRKVFPKISSTMMPQWRGKDGGKIITLLLQIGWKIHRNFKYEEFGFTELDSFIQNSITDDESKVKFEQPEQIKFGEIELAIYKFLHKGITWANNTRTKIEQKYSVKIDLEKPFLSVQKIKASFNSNDFQMQKVEYQQLKNDEDYILKFLQNRMNCFEIHFYKQIRNNKYRKFDEFFNQLLLKDKNIKKQENDQKQIVKKLSTINQWQQKDSALTQLTTKTFKNKWVQANIEFDCRKLQKIDIASIIQSQNNETPQEGEIRIQYEYFRRSVLRIDSNNYQHTAFKKQKLMSKRILKEEQDKAINKGILKEEQGQVMNKGILKDEQKKLKSQVDNSHQRLIKSKPLKESKLNYYVHDI